MWATLGEMRIVLFSYSCSCKLNVASGLYRKRSIMLCTIDVSTTV